MSGLHEGVVLLMMVEDMLGEDMLGDMLGFEST